VKEKMVDYPLFPLTDPFERLILSLEFILVVIFMELGVYFFYKYWKNKKDAIPSVVELDWAILFGAFGVAYLFYIIGDFFVLEGNYDTFIFVGYLSLLIGYTLLLYHLESTGTFKTKYLFTLLSAGLSIVIILVFLFSPSLLQTISSSFMILAFVAIALYFFTIIKRIWKFYKFRSIGLLSGIILWLLGYAGNSDVAIDLFGSLAIRAAADIVTISGIVLLAVFVNSIPSLAEIGWHEKIKYIILTTQSGMSLYTENFQERKEIDDLSISGAIWGIQVFLQNILSEDANLKVISRGSDVVLREEGKNIIGLLVVEQELEILKYILKQLVQRFEEYYSDILEDWSGEIDLFEPTKHLVDDIFSGK
jgi:hypothetical protein